MIIRIIGFLAVAIVGALGPMKPVMACTCGAKPVGAPLEIAGTTDEFHDVGFLGRAIEVGKAITASPDEASRGSYVPTTFDVEFFNTNPPTDRDAPVVVLQPSGGVPNGTSEDCSFGFVAGNRYIVEAHRNSDGTYSTNGCTLTSAFGLQSTETTEEGGGGFRTWLIVAAALAVVAYVFAKSKATRRPGVDYGEFSAEPFGERSPAPTEQFPQPPVRDPDVILPVAPQPIQPTTYAPPPEPIPSAPPVAPSWAPQTPTPQTPTSATPPTPAAPSTPSWAPQTPAAPTPAPEAPVSWVPQTPATPEPPDAKTPDRPEPESAPSPPEPPSMPPPPSPRPDPDEGRSSTN